jgi:two-component system chemotaxis sensor kinase CheA
MDGFELTERIRADTRLRQLPIVLVTALEKREDHDRGIRLGANAYMMKSAFDQSMLIDLVRRVI